VACLFSPLTLGYGVVTPEVKVRHVPGVTVPKEGATVVEQTVVLPAPPPPPLPPVDGCGRAVGACEHKDGWLAMPHRY
jgi:hypothetical protein